MPVKVLTPQNAYIYKSRILLISYISGVAATAICVAVGLVCISKASSAAFGTSFSTIVRTTRNPELDRLVSPAETSGAEPLSKELAAIKLRLVQGKKPIFQDRSDSEGEVDAETTSEDDWSCFAVSEDPSVLRLVPPLRLKRKKPVASDSDLDSLLVPGDM